MVGAVVLADRWPVCEDQRKNAAVLLLTPAICLHFTLMSI